MTSLSSRARRLWIDDKAVAAVEFAMVVPFMLLLYVGGVELGNGMAINVKVTATAHSVADMVSQNTQLTTAQMQNILGASAAILAPYATTGSSGNSLVTVTVSEISADTNGNLTLRWSQSYNGTSFGAGRTSLGANGVYAAVTLPPSLNGTAGNANNPNSQNDNVSFIVGEATYAYTPNLGYTVSGTVTLADSFYVFPRCSTNSPANSGGPAYYDIKYPVATNCTCIQHLQQKTC
jgi:Flp pilus assembly protein TadG